MSYNTVEQANVYVSSHYLSSDEARVRWELLTDEDKQVLLNKSHDTMLDDVYAVREKK